MGNPALNCLDESRRQKVRDAVDLGVNGIDYVDVSDDQLSLCVHLFGQVPDTLDTANVRIEGGRRIRDIRVVAVEAEHQPDPALEECLRVTVDKAGDFSTYTLRLVEVQDGQPTGKPLAGFDPRYAQIDFSFKVNCPSDLDCKTEAVCPPEVQPTPEINYLAKDYGSFRQLILDRLSLVMPDWKERHVPDLGIALVEILAYAGDYLSYQQDAVGTEAYLDTARSRISVRRHARLVDYRVHEGTNARAWVCIEADGHVSLKPDDIYFVTATAELAALSGYVITEDQVRGVAEDQYEVFEPLLDHGVDSIEIYSAQNKISFYTWGDRQCCLPKGATRATLQDGPAGGQGGSLNLSPGDVLIFEEVKGPTTGNPADADPTHRQAVRLTSVEPGSDQLHNQPVVEIEWSQADALLFALCISAMLPAPDCSIVEDVSVARGNVILVDHGRWVSGEKLGTVPTEEKVGTCACEGSVVEMTEMAGNFAPKLQGTPLTFRQALPEQSAAASAMFNQDPRQALPQITLTGLPASAGDEANPEDPKWQDPKWKWCPQYDLLNSGRNDRDFVVELENDGIAHIRFGDGDLGRKPDAGMTFSAKYRVGNGPAGNVGRETISYLVLRPGVSLNAELTPRNPMPAQGGTPSEPPADVKMFAPIAFRKDLQHKGLQRAITADDYARIAGRNRKVQRAAAALRWTGSWYEAQVAIDPLGTEEANPELLDEIKGCLHRFRRMGHDLSVMPARYVPMDLELTVCVLPHYLRGHVEAALLDRFSNRALPDGSRGFFHPDELTFGQGIAVSTLVAAAQAVEGVQSVEVTKLERQFEGPNCEIANGILAIGPMEIAQLDNDPSFPERGRLTLVMKGGR